MTKKQLLIWLTQVGLFSALGALEFVDQNSFGQTLVAKALAIFIADQRLVISIVLGVVFAIITGWKDLLQPRRRAKEIRERIMETMLEELFHGDRNNYRITIFKDANLFRRLQIYFRLWKEYFRAWKRNETILRPKRGRFVYVWERLGTEHPNSKTFYYYTKETAISCQGIAGTVMQSLSDMVVQDLPDIQHIDLEHLDLKNKRIAATRSIRDYMTRGYIRDFQTLKRLHRHARHVYGNVLNNLDGKPKGVLIIDSFLDQSFLTPDVARRLTHYAAILGATM